MIIATSSLS